VRKDDIEVRIDGDQLVITGKPQEESAEGAWLLRERRQGGYERRFTIDTTIDRDRIDAVFERGIMTLTLRVKEEVKPRRVEISSR
jgi:HSP20 family protein